MENIGQPQFVPGLMEVHYGVEIPTVNIGCGPGPGPGIPGPTGPQGPQGEHGHLGPQGYQGDPAPAWKVKSILDSVSSLPTEGVPGDAYMVGDLLYIYIGPGKGTTDTPGDAYLSTPSAITGPTGPQGVQGHQGYQGLTGLTGATGAQGPAGIANYMLDRRVYLSEPITVRVKNSGFIGGYKDGDIIPKGTSLRSILVQLFTDRDLATYQIPLLEIDTPQPTSYHTGQARRVQAEFIKNDAGDVLRWMITLNSEVLATGEGNLIDFIDSVDRVGNLTYSLTVDYNDGPIKYDSEGNPIPGRIEDGTLSASVVYNYIMTQNFFYLVSNTNINPDNLTELNQYTALDREVIPGDIVNIPIAQGSMGIAILVASDVNVSRIVDTNFNVNAIESFTQYDKQYVQDGVRKNFRLYVLNSMTELTETTYKVYV